jgi:hypothetical protein
MKKVATLILNRNLPLVTDRLVDHLKKYDGEFTDIYVIEAGSDYGNLSKYATWHANSKEEMQDGLRYSRGMNYGLSELWKEDKFDSYEAFFLLTNDVEFSERATVEPLLEILDSQKSIGILSPCSPRWGEHKLLNDIPTKYFWFIHNNAYMLRRQFVRAICDRDHPNKIDFLFDGENFRGYGAEMELIAKAYANDWSAAITRDVLAIENESYLLNQSDLIKTQAYEENLQLYLVEGERWMRKKYGFNSRWVMMQYVKSMYENFFYFHPELNKYKI